MEKEERSECWEQREVETERERPAGRSRGSVTHGIHVEIRSELNRICSVPADSANAPTIRELYARLCVYFQRAFPPFLRPLAHLHPPCRHSVYFFSPRPRTNSAFNCARRADDIFLLLLRSRRMFRFNKIPRSRAAGRVLAAVQLEDPESLVAKSNRARIPSSREFRKKTKSRKVESRKSCGEQDGAACNGCGTRQETLTFQGQTERGRKRRRERERE